MSRKRALSRARTHDILVAEVNGMMYHNQELPIDYPKWFIKRYKKILARIRKSRN